VSDPKHGAETEVELAADLAHEAVELVAGELQPSAEVGDGALGERGARRGEMTSSGRARDLEDRRERVDAESIDEVQAQHVALAELERSERGDERLAKVDPEALPDQRELGVDTGDRLGLTGAFGDVAVAGTAPLVRERAAADDLQPGEQRAAAAVLSESWRLAVHADEQLGRDHLLDLVEHARIGALAVQQARQLREELPVERRERDGISVETRAHEVQIGSVGHVAALGDAAREPLRRDLEIGPRGSRLDVQFIPTHASPTYHAVVDACLDDETVMGLVCGTLEADSHARVQQHLDGCDACRELVAYAAPEDATDEWEHLQIGARLGRYEITDVIGAGAMGFVFAANDPELGRTVALKLLRSNDTTAEALRPRLLREAQALAKLSHPNVVTVHDVGMFAEHLFVALEWVDGGTLATWLAQRRSRREIVAAFRQAGEGLAAAHAAGLVHRDVKPDNILVGKDGRVRVTDFGLAASSGATIPEELPLRLTVEGALVGTPAYVSPEQLDGSSADARSDQFSFCIALFEALHGYKPFPGDDWPTLRASLRAGVVEHRPGPRVPYWLDRIVIRGLARDPEQRWPSVRALLAAIDRGPIITPSRITIGLAAIAAVSLFAARHHRAHVCDDLPAWDVWTDGALGSRVAAPVSATVDHGFRTYGTAWQQMQLESCRATEVSETQLRDVAEARARCLADHRDYATELAQALLTGPVPRTDGAIEAVESLPNVADCTHPTTTPATPLAIVRKANLQTRMARTTIDGYLRADIDPNRFQALANEAHALGEPALEARALLLRARYESNEDDEEAALHHSALAALAAHDDGALADAWQRLAFHAGFHAAHHAESEQWGSYAQGVIDRLGGDPVREAELLMSRGFALNYEGRAEQALHNFSRARELFIQARGNDYWRISIALYGEGASMLAMQKFDQALDLYRRSRELALRVGGTTSQAYISASDNEANALIDLHRLDEGLALFAELDRTTTTSSWREEQISAALRNAERFSEALDYDRRATELARAEHATGPRALYPEAGTGADLAGLGRPLDALPFLEHVLAVRRQRPPDGELADAELQVAQALVAAKGDRARAKQLAMEARAILVPLGAPVADSVREIDNWLATVR
jgi:eukaryotic-like serine/threonine-protein kinase